jgi:pimeloyl-ACP methyl ester carboxylesterase
MPFVECRGARLHYERTGDGDPILWLPGTGLCGGTWLEQVAVLSRTYTCVTVDLPGSGESGLAQESSIRAMADDVSDLVDALGALSTHVVGLSMGSAVAQELALRRPELVRSATMVGTWSSTAREHHIRRHFESRLYALEHGPLDVFAQFAFWMSSHSIIDEEPDLQSLVEERLAAHTSLWPEGTASHFRADLNHETRDRLGDISCPVLVVHGDEDLITLPRYNQVVARAVPNARLISIPRAGHLVWIERAKAVTDAIATFLAGDLDQPGEVPYALSRNVAAEEVDR